jgi:anti-anti-sigma factor
VTAHATPSLRIRVAPVVEAPVVTLAGEIDLSTVDRLASALEPLDGRVVVDLHGVSFLDCMGIGILVAVRNRLLVDGGDLHLRSPQAQVRRMLTILGLHDWIVDNDQRIRAGGSNGARRSSVL